MEIFLLREEYHKNRRHQLTALEKDECCKNKNFLSFIINWLWLSLNSYKILELTVTSSYIFHTFFVQLKSDSFRKKFSDMLMYFVFICLKYLLDTAVFMVPVISLMLIFNTSSIRRNFFF